MIFRYYNINPLGITENDCVCRAISLALDIDYNYIYYLLYSNSYYNSCDTLTKTCYRQILEDRYDLQPQSGKGYKVKDIASKYPNSNTIIRINGHLTSSKNGVIYDIWDCSNEIVDEYWVVY